MLNVQTTLPKNTKKSKGRRRGEVLDPKTHEIADRFQSYQRKTAECFIEMGRIVIEAKSRSRQEFEDFCLLIGYDSCSSTIRKLAAIGQKYEYLISRSDKLPPSWTVIYEISRLSEEVIEDYIDSNKITSKTSGTAIDKLLVAQNLKSAAPKPLSAGANPKNVPIRTTTEFSFRAVLKDGSSAEMLFDLDEALQNLKEMGFELTISESLREAISQSKTFEMTLMEA